MRAESATGPSRITAGPARKTQIAADLRKAGFRVPTFSYTLGKLSQLPLQKYDQLLGSLTAIRREIKRPGLLDLYLPSAANLARLNTAFLDANRALIVGESLHNSSLDLGNLPALLLRAMKTTADDSADAAVPTTPMPATDSEIRRIAVGKTDHLLDVIGEEKVIFQRLAYQAPDVDKLFHSLEHGKNRLGFENVVVFRPAPKREGETAARWVKTQQSRSWGDSKYDPQRGGSEPDSTLKSVIEGAATVYDVDINDKRSFEAAGLAADPASIVSDLQRSKGPGRMLFFKLVGESGNVEAVVQIHNRVGLDEAIDPPTLLPADRTTAVRIKTGLDLYFAEFVRAIDAVRRRTGTMAAAIAEVTPARPPQVSETASKADSTPRPDLVHVTKLTLDDLPPTHIKSYVPRIVLIVFHFIGAIVKVALGRLGRAIQPSETTKLIEFYNAGMKIKAYLDYPEKVKPDKATWVVLPPAFSKTKETTFYLALYLKKNGIGVLRYDDTCSVGESDGEIYDMTLSNSTSNIVAAVRYLEQSVNPARIGLVPFSLSARTSLKAAARLGDKISFLMPIVGAGNIQSLLSRVCGDDPVADGREGKIGERNLLGHMVNGTFMKDALEQGFADLTSTMEDMAKIRVPIVWACGSDDPWIDQHEVREILAVNPAQVRHDLIICEGLGHRIRVAGKAREIFAQVVSEIKTLAEGREIRAVNINHPTDGEIVQKAVEERRRIRKVISREEEIANWNEYLKGFDALLMSEDYVDYLSSIWQALDARPGDSILDVGCGNGNFLALCLKNMATRTTKSAWNAGKLVGIDFVKEALERAEEKTHELRGNRRDLPQPEFHRVDVEAGAIPGGRVNKIVASLFLSYLQKPEVAVKKMCDKLERGGTIVLTSLKPDADVSNIYFRFLEKLKEETAHMPKAEQEAKLASARHLLNAAMGWIEVGEEEGHFKYHSAEALAEMLRKNGLEIVSTRRSFGDQADVVVARKKAA